MIANILVMIRAEWFKLRRRPMPWILLGIMVLIGQALIWSGYRMYAALASRGADVTILTSYLSNFMLPASLVWVYRVVPSVGLIMVAILTAQVLGSEYGLGTLRPVLIQGVGRTAYLAGKVLMLVLASGAALLATGALAAVSSLIATALASVSPETAPTILTWGDLFSGLAVTWLVMVPYIALTAMATVLSRKASVGMAISLGYYVLEAVLSAMMGLVSPALARLSDYLILRSITAVSNGGLIGSATMASPADATAAWRLLAYTVVMVAVTLGVFIKRDIHGPSGG